jgi:hypothetical protein
MTGNEKRKGLRVRRHEPLRVREGENGYVRAQAMDRSEGGLCFVSAVPFESESELDIRVNGNDKDLRARVLSCEKAINGFSIRARFAGES